MVNCPECGNKLWKMGYVKVDPETDEEISNTGTRNICLKCGYVEGDNQKVILTSTHEKKERKADDVIKGLSNELNHDGPFVGCIGQYFTLPNGFYVSIKVGRTEDDLD